MKRVDLAHVIDDMPVQANKQPKLCSSNGSIQKNHNNSIKNVDNNLNGNGSYELNLHSADFVCYTKDEVLDRKFEWVIEDFKPEMYEMGEMLTSEEFPAKNDIQETWVVRMYPKGCMISSSDGSLDAKDVAFTLAPIGSTVLSEFNYYRASLSIFDTAGKVLLNENISVFGGIHSEYLMKKFSRPEFEEAVANCQNITVLIDFTKVDDPSQRRLLSVNKSYPEHSRMVSRLSAFRFVWKIDNFPSMLADVREQFFVESAPFSIQPSRRDPENSYHKANYNDPRRWSLNLYPRGKDDNFKDYLSIFVRLLKGPEVKAVVELSLLNNKGVRVNVKQLPLHLYTINKRWGVGDFIKISQLKEQPHVLLPSSDLYLMCKIKMYDRLSAVVERSGTYSIDTSSSESTDVCKQINFLYDALLKKKMCDVKFRVRDEEFSAHRLVLCLHSSVFKDMLSNQIEGRDCITFNDLDPKVFSCLLEFIYTGKVSAIDKFALDLFGASDTFAISSLKEYCEKHIMSSITVDNASELYILADRFQSHVLRQRVLDFIVSNTLQVMETSGWKQLKSQYPNVIEQVLMALARRK